MASPSAPPSTLPHPTPSTSLTACCCCSRAGSSTLAPTVSAWLLRLDLPSAPDTGNRLAPLTCADQHPPVLCVASLPPSRACKLAPDHLHTQRFSALLCFSRASLCGPLLQRRQAGPGLLPYPVPLPGGAQGGRERGGVAGGPDHTGGHAVLRAAGCNMLVVFGVKWRTCWWTRPLTWAAACKLAATSWFVIWVWRLSGGVAGGPDHPGSSNTERGAL